MTDIKEVSPLQTSVTNLAKSALDAIKASRERIDTEIEILTGKISELEKNKATERSGLLSLDDYSNFLLEEIKRRGANYGNLWLNSRCSSQPGRDQQHNTMRWPNFVESEVGNLLNAVLKPDVTSDALCFLFPEVMHERLMDYLRKWSKWARGEDVGIDKRRDALKAIEEQIATLNEQREDLFRQLNDIKEALKTR